MDAAAVAASNRVAAASSARMALVSRDRSLATWHRNGREEWEMESEGIDESNAADGEQQQSRQMVPRCGETEGRRARTSAAAAGGSSGGSFGMASATMRLTPSPSALKPRFQSELDLAVAEAGRGEAGAEAEAEEAGAAGARLCHRAGSGKGGGERARAARLSGGRWSWTEESAEEGRTEKCKERVIPMYQRFSNIFVNPSKMACANRSGHIPHLSPGPS